MKILTGRIAGKNHYSEPDSIAATNSLVTGMTRSGKSYKLRTMAEAISPVMPTWVIDPEDEFYSLREKYPFLLFGEGGEAPLAVQTARLMARKLLGWGVSAVLSLAALREEEQHEWVFQFIDELMNQPRPMWRRAVIIVDEAHLFAPNSGHGKSDALLAARNLARRGLKRGLIPIWATQRLASLSVAVSSSCENLMVGRTTRSADQEQAAKLLGIAKLEKMDLAAKLRKCKRGNFYAVGPAYGEDIITLETIPAKTTHFSGKIGQEPEKLPLPKKLEYLLPELDIMLSEIQLLEASKEETPAQELDRLRVIVAERTDGMAPSLTNEQLIELQTALEQERELKGKSDVRADGLTLGVKVLRDKIHSLEQDALTLTADIANRVEALRTTAQDVAQHATAVLADGAFDQAEAAQQLAEGDARATPATLTRREHRILVAFRECETIGMSEWIPRVVLAQMAGIGYSGQFQTECGALRKRGYVSSRNNNLALTAAGKVMVPPSTKEFTQETMLDRLRKSVGDEAAEVAELLVRRRGLWMPFAEVCKQCKYTPASDRFRKIVTKLRAAEVIEYRAKDKHMRIAERIIVGKPEAA